MTAEIRAVDWQWCRDCEREVALDGDGMHCFADGTELCVGELAAYHIVTTESGRRLLVTDEGEILAVHTQDGPWRPRSRDDAEWCVEQLVDARAGLAAVEVRRKAYLSSLDRQAAAELRRVDWWLRLLEEWTRGELDGTKYRHVDVDGARLKLYRTPPRTEVPDEPQVIAAIGETHPAVKTERRLLVSQLSAAAKKALAAAGLLVVHPGEDRFGVDTGS